MKDKCIEALKVHQEEYLNTVWKTFAALMVAIGWIMSSDETRKFLSCEPAVRYVGMAVVFLMAVMHLLTLLDLHKKSANITNTLSVNEKTSEDQISKAIASSYEIKSVYVAASFLINGLLYILLITILLSVH